MAWKDLAADKKRRIDASIPPEWRLETQPTDALSVMDYPKQSGIMNAEEIAITESSAASLVRKMASGELTSVAVTHAFCKRAALAHQLVSDHGFPSQAAKCFTRILIRVIVELLP
jgi:amidase